MKKIFQILLILLLAKFSFAQIELKATMGINLVSITSLNDYINQIYAPVGEELSSFNTAAIFSFEAGYFIYRNFVAGIEIPYQIYSYNTYIEGAGQYDLYYDELLPSIMAYYVISGTGYNFKFGGGLGPRFVFVTEEKKWQGTQDDFSSVGFGGLLRIEANTALAENLFANIGGDLRYDLNGEPENNNGNTLINENEPVNFNTFSLGIKLGLTYIIGGSN